MNGKRSLPITLPKVAEQLLRILDKHYICTECLGRQFALLGTYMSNSERASSILNTILLEIGGYISDNGESLDKDTLYELLSIIYKIADRVGYEQAIKSLNRIMENFPDLREDKRFIGFMEVGKNPEFTCHLCNNIMFEINKIADMIIECTRNYEFTTFLMGTIPNPQLQEREDELRAELGITGGESFKKNLNRLLGRRLNVLWSGKKKVDYERPEVNINIEIGAGKIEIGIISNPLCIMGNYRKYVRGIPQTHWPHKACNGRGCEECGYTGKQYSTSVEELITPWIQKYTLGDDAKFHGAGREDIDARCLGNGRPFIVEIKHPRNRNLPLKLIEKEIREDHGNIVDVINLKIVDRNYIPKLKQSGEKTSKVYEAAVEFEEPITEEFFRAKMEEIKEKIEGKYINQRTPLRVVHRRIDRVRKRKIYSVEGEFIDEIHARFRIKAMGGTYIKELIHGDEGRTRPSFAEIFGIPMRCTELDILEVSMNHNIETEEVPHREPTASKDDPNNRKTAE